MNADLLLGCPQPERLRVEEGKSTTINAWTNNGAKQRLDEQIHELPASFQGRTLVSLTITDSGSTDMQRSFLAALTVSTDGP